MPAQLGGNQRNGIYNPPTLERATDGQKKNQLRLQPPILAEFPLAGSASLAASCDRGMG
jgi:hypothetical protein